MEKSLSDKEWILTRWYARRAQRGYDVPEYFSQFSMALDRLLLRTVRAQQQARRLLEIAHNPNNGLSDVQAELSANPLSDASALMQLIILEREEGPSALEIKTAKQFKAAQRKRASNPRGTEKQFKEQVKNKWLSFEREKQELPKNEREYKTQEAFINDVLTAWTSEDGEEQISRGGVLGWISEWKKDKNHTINNAT